MVIVVIVDVVVFVVMVVLVGSVVVVPCVHMFRVCIPSRGGTLGRVDMSLSL